MVNNRAFNDIKIGEKGSISKTISEADIYTFAGISGDFNPLHISEECASKSRFKKRIAHGMHTASLISTVLGTDLPGANTIYLSQDIRFMAPAFIGDTLTATVEVIKKTKNRNMLTLKTTVTNQSGKILVNGQATVMKD